MVRISLMMAVLAGLWTTAAAAQQFRIESQVFAGNDNKQIADNLTLFDNQQIYDFSMTPDGSGKVLEIVIYDSARQNFILLDIARELKVELPQFVVVQMLEASRSRVAADEKMKWMLESGYTETLDLEQQTARLEAAEITYDSTCEMVRDAAIQSLAQQFLDNYTMLTATDPQRVPPFARMRFNQMLKKHGLFAREIRLSIAGDGVMSRPVEARSTHSLITKLSSVDKQRIDLAKKYWVSFADTSLENYRVTGTQTAQGDSTDRENRKR